MSAATGAGWYRELYLDGAWRPSTSAVTHRINDPATGKQVGSTALADTADLAAAVDAAERSEWSSMSPGRRGQILRRGADLIDERIDAIARRLTEEQGKPVPDSIKEVAFAARVFRYYAELGATVFGSLRPSDRVDMRSIVEYHPVGTVAAIVPWNYPVDLYAWKVAPALAAGCPVIAKPPQDACGAAGLVVQALADAGLPPGALADLPGEAELGQAMVTDPRIAAVTATASTATGQRIMAAAAPTLKRLVLELGGQSPFVVLADADIDEAAAAAVRRSFSNMGQICIAVNRVLVDRSVHARFVDAVVDRTRALQLGHPLDPGVEYGPVFNDGVRAKVQTHIDDAVARDARLLTGGGPSSELGSRFFAPTVLDDVSPDALMMTEETFGPALGILAADGVDELLAHANALPYGLAAYVYTGDLERGWAFASRVEAGGVGVNVNDVTELQAPFGGWKLSGFGSDLGPESLHQFLRPKHVRLRVRPLS